MDSFSESSQAVPTRSSEIYQYYHLSTNSIFYAAGRNRAFLMPEAVCGPIRSWGPWKRRGHLNTKVTRHIFLFWDIRKGVFQVFALRTNQNAARMFCDTNFPGISTKEFQQNSHAQMWNQLNLTFLFMLSNLAGNLKGLQSLCFRANLWSCKPAVCIKQTRKSCRDWAAIWATSLKGFVVLTVKILIQNIPKFLSW